MRLCGSGEWLETGVAAELFPGVIPGRCSGLTFPGDGVRATKIANGAGQIEPAKQHLANTTWTYLARKIDR